MFLSPGGSQKQDKTSASDPYKIAVLGDVGVGKSALVVRFLTRRFIREYDSTTDQVYKHSMTVDEEHADLEILDVTGTDSTGREKSFRWADGFLMVYSIKDQSSFDYLNKLWSELDESRKQKNAPVVLVGNKRDLEENREVSSKEGEDLAVQNASVFFEVSACTDTEGINEAMTELCSAIRRRRIVSKLPRRRSSSGQHIRHALHSLLAKLH